jgi:hypothetical protein
VRIVGRIINLSTEDTKLKADSIGIMNTSEENGQVFKLRLNLGEVPIYTLFEGEVVVAEGCADSNSKFNVNRIFKPEINSTFGIPKSVYDFDFLKRCQAM